MEKWEYKTWIPSYGERDYGGVLNAFGEYGWELVAVMGGFGERRTFYFKKKLLPPIKS